jgi:hypothetical protein
LRGVAAEERGEGHHVIGLAQAPAGVTGGDPVDVGVVDGRLHTGGVGESGCQRHGADTVVCEFPVDDVGQDVHARFGHAVRCLAGIGLHSDHAADVDDAASSVAEHHRREVLGGEEAAHEVAVDRAAENVEVEQARGLGQPSDVVDQSVHPAPSFIDRGRCCGDLTLGGQSGGESAAEPACRAGDHDDFAERSDMRDASTRQQLHRHFTTLAEGDQRV